MTAEPSGSLADILLEHPFADKREPVWSNATGDR